LLRLLGHFGTQPDGAGGLDALDGGQELADLEIGGAPRAPPLLFEIPLIVCAPI